MVRAFPIAAIAASRPPASPIEHKMLATFESCWMFRVRQGDSRCDGLKVIIVSLEDGETRDAIDTTHLTPSTFSLWALRLARVFQLH